MHPNRGADDSVQLQPLVCLINFWSTFILNWIDLTLDYEIVLHLLLPEVQVRTVEPSNLLRLISDEPDVDAI